MKQSICALLLLCIARIAFGQSPSDSLLIPYRLAKNDVEKRRCLDEYLQHSSSEEAFTAHVVSLSSWFKKEEDLVGANYINTYLADILRDKGDYVASLDLSLSTLPYYEKRNDTDQIISINATIASAYFGSKNFEQAALYFKKNVSLISGNDPDKILSSYYNGIGCFYGEGGMPDSGMVYAQKAVQIDTETKNYQNLALSLSTLAENYIAAKEFDIALPFLRRSLGYYQSKQVVPDDYLFSYLKNDFAQVFLETGYYDSTKYYAYQSLQISEPSQFDDQRMRSYEYLYKTFEQSHQLDSTYKYFRLAMTIKDSIFDFEKSKSIQALSFREELRQQELEVTTIKEEKERRQNIQLALMAIGIVSLVIVFIFLSQSFITNTKLITFFGAIALLLVFEFINILLHPFLEDLTHHSPILMLLSLVLIAVLLVPLHHKLEKWTNTKLVEKNKATRLANAKKTIEKLETH